MLTTGFLKVGNITPLGSIFLSEETLVYKKTIYNLCSLILRTKVIKTMTSITKIVQLPYIWYYLDITVL